MRKRTFCREFKVEAVKMVRERGASEALAGRDLDVHENVLRKWVKEFGSEPVQAFPGHEQMKPEQQEIERLRREVAKLKAERTILKGPQSTSRRSDMKFVFIAIDGGDAEGNIRRATGRLWPQSELAKAWIAQAESGEAGAADEAHAALLLLERHYLSHLVAGGWHDQGVVS